MEDTQKTPENRTRLGIRADAARRANQAAQLRVAGHSWDEVASALHFANAQNAIRSVRSFFGSLPQPDREDLRALARARGEYLWRRAVMEVDAQRAGALRAAVAVLDRQAKLDGLDEPQRLAVTADDAELDQIVDRLLRASGRVVRESPQVVALPVLDAEVVDEQDPQTD